MGARAVGGGKQERRREEDLGGWGMICRIYSGICMNRQMCLFQVSRSPVGNIDSVIDEV